MREICFSNHSNDSLTIKIPIKQRNVYKKDPVEKNQSRKTTIPVYKDLLRFPIRVLIFESLVATLGGDNF